MIKRTWKKIKHYWIDFLKIIFKRWIPEQVSKKEVALGLYDYIIKNQSEYFSCHCPVCGQEITIKDIQEKHYTNDFLILIYKCSKCNLNVQRRYEGGTMDEIKTM